MAIQACQSARDKGNEISSWLAPIIWKLRFDSDVRSKLLKECEYVEARLGISDLVSNCAAQRVYQIYLNLAKRDYYQTIQADDCFADMPLRELHDRILDKSKSQLVSIINIKENNHQAVLRKTRQWLRQNETHNENQSVKSLLKIYRRWLRLNDCSFSSETISQEQIAEHIKRIRCDFCQGSLRDRINAFVPQAAGPRTAHIRAVEPIAVHDVLQDQSAPDPANIMQQVRDSMQQKLDALNNELEQRFNPIKVFNPFYLTHAG